MVNTRILVFFKLRQLILTDVNHGCRLSERCGEILQSYLLLSLLCGKEKREVEGYRQELEAWLVIAAMTWFTAAGRNHKTLEL